MSIAVGSLITAPTGFGPLEAGRSYRFLRRCCTRTRVLLVHLSETNQARASLIVLGAQAFETALQRPAPDGLLVHQPGDALPPWLSLVSLSPTSPSPGLHLDRIEQRLALIEPALERAEEILEAYDPISDLNKIARACPAKQNETRYRTWFLAFLLFGRPGLEPCYRHTGRWPRSDGNAALKRGRPSLSAGRSAGYNVTQAMAKMIHDGFIKHVVVGDTWPRIYHRCLRSVFGVRGPLDGRGRAVLHHPAGDPFPSLNQFRYWVVKGIGLENSQAARLGEASARFRHQAAKGSYSNSLSTLMERVEADAFHVDEHPTSRISGELMDKLCVVRLCDVLTRMLIGIGFSFGHEIHEAYRMALLCAAMDKVQFCAIFGVHIRAHQWPCIGVPHQYVTDRGPGANRRAPDVSPIHTAPPSYQPQGKPYIESSNPKSKEIDGAPQHVQSPLCPMDMIRREIRSLLNHNESADIYQRSTTEARCVLDAFTPNSLWSFYSARGRTSAHLIAFDQAIKSYGLPGTATLTPKGVVMAGQTYNAQPLLPHLNRIVRSGRVEITVYRIPFALGVLWADIGGRLYQLQHQEPAVCGVPIAALCDLELDKLRVRDRALQSQHRSDRHGTAVHHADEFERETGQPWDARKVVTGRRKIGEVAKAEAAAVRDLHRRKSA